MDNKTETESVGFLEFDCELDFSIDIEEIAKILPPWKTLIKAAKLTDEEGLPKLQLKLLIAASTPEQVQLWRKDLEELSGCRYAIRSTEKCVGWYVDFKQRLKCQRNTRCSCIHNEASRNRTRNTNCPSSITITIRSIKKHPRGQEDTRANADMPCEILFVATHNHDVKSQDALKFRAVSDETKQRLLELFESGHTPATARETIKIDLQLNHRDSEAVLADRKYYPDYNYCYHLYTTDFKRKCKPLELNSEGKRLLFERLEAIGCDPPADWLGSVCTGIADTENYEDVDSGNSNNLVSSLVSSEEALTEGKEIIDEVCKKFNEFLEDSPCEVLQCLRLMKERLDRFNNAAEFVPACANYASGSDTT